MSDNRETSEEGADVEHGQPTPPAATSDELPADDEDAVGPPVSLSPQVSDAGESPEAEPADEVDASEAESTSAADDHKPSETKAEYSIEEMLALEQENDPQRNTETRPPAGETVTFRSVTTAEVYIGREADSLAAALGKLEWVNQDELIADNIAEARKTDEYYKAQFVLLSRAASPSKLWRLRKIGAAGRSRANLRRVPCARSLDRHASSNVRPCPG